MLTTCKCSEDACTGEHLTQKQPFNMDLSEQQDVNSAQSDDNVERGGY